MANVQQRNRPRPPQTAIQDIALAAGVSVATVSRVLNGRPDVAASTREVVLRHIRELGYVGNRSARALAGGRTGLIGLTVPYIHGNYFTEIISGAAESLYERDARLVVCPTQHQHDREISLLERLMQGTTDGALMIFPSESPAELAALQHDGYRFVVIDPPGQLDERIPVIAATNWSGGRIATEHLIALGHRRIGAITGRADAISSADRLAGYHSALLAAGLAGRPELVQQGDFTIESGHAAAQPLLDLAQPPTAIFAFNDNMAIGVLRAAYERGIAIPDDLSVVGFDDVELARVVRPALTTVRQPLRELGRLGVEVLYRVLSGQPHDPTRIELSTRLVVRDSTATPR